MIVDSTVKVTYCSCLVLNTYVNRGKVLLLFYQLEGALAAAFEASKGNFISAQDFHQMHVNES